MGSLVNPFYRSNTKIQSVGIEKSFIFTIIIIKLMKKIKIIVLLVIVSLKSMADEGMWLPFLLETLNEKEMKLMGMKISAKDIYNINKGSLKDAIVMFGGGCTGEVISEQGLVLTNHHCGFGYIQRLSTLTNNYVANGFWSKNQTEELPAPGLSVTFISRMEDVTNMALQGVEKKMSEQQRQAQIDKNINNYRNTVKKESFETISVRPFYNGNMYIMIVSVVYNDIRLAAAPPESIGAYGHDTDNWVWPRHAGDFSVFRIYADANNNPSAYSPTNKPYKPKRSLSINMKGVKEGDFTMVFGFPGRTNQYLPAIAVQQTLEKNNPIKINIRDEVLKAQKQFMQNDENIKLQYSSKYAGIANSWKKWIGENLGLQRSNAVEKKLNYEKLFTQKLNANPAWKTAYSNLLPDLNELYKEGEADFYVRDAYNEMINNCEILSQAAQLISFQNALETSDEASVNKDKETIKSRMAGYFKDYSAKVDQLVLSKVLNVFFNKVKESYWQGVPASIWNSYDKNADKMAQEIFAKSFLVSKEKFDAFINAPNGDLLGKLKNDQAYQFLKALRDVYAKTIGPKVNDLQNQINALQREYMQAQMTVMAKDRKIYPDANSTLRVTYGKVKGYQPKDGAFYAHQTYLEGVMEKYIPGDYEFDVPEKLLELYNKKDYGQYGVKGRMPVCFIAANHTTGGNSGSPALDANGNLVGLNFDRVWEGTMSDINYDVNICRNIMVDIRYVLFIIDKMGGSGHLVKEMKLIK
jgi:hypothetical protein